MSDISALLHDVRDILDGPNPFVALLTNGSGERCDVLHALAAESVPDVVCLETNCESPFPLAFGPISDLISQLLERANPEREGLVARFGPELTAWVPSFVREAGDATPDLRAIAHGGAKRRLQSDSEILHRLFEAFPSMLIEALDTWQSLAGKTLLIALHNLDAADRLTLGCLTRLHSQVSDPRLRIVFSAPATIDAFGKPWVWNDDEDPPLTDSARDLTDAYLLHRHFWQTTLDRCSPVTLRIADPAPSADGAASDAERVAMLLAALGAPVEIARTMVNLPADRPSVLGPEARFMSRAHRLRLRRSIPLEQQRLLHDAIGSALVARQADGEEALLIRAYHALRSTSPEAGLPVAVEAASRSLSWSFNYDAVLFCCRDILRLAGASRHRDEYCRAAWQLIGLANTYVGRHPESLAAFANAYELSSLPELKAQTSYYAGLVASKRIKDHTRGSSWFHRGIEHVRAANGPLARLERGWLLNGTALLAWKEGRLGDAGVLIRQALSTTGSPSDAELLNLRINLLNNLSVLQESLGDPIAALETWRLLSEYAQRAPALIGRSFFYRDGWLRLAADDLKGAADSYRVAFSLAECVSDVFHMDLTAMACGFVASARERMSEAREWYECVVRLRQRHRVDAVAEAWACLGHVALQRGDTRQAWSDFDAGALVSHRTGLDIWANRLTNARDALTGGGAARLAAAQSFHGISLVQPKSKLTSDFGVADLIAGVPLAMTTTGGSV